MKKIAVLSCLLVISMAIYAQDGVMRMDNDPSQQFLLQINAILGDVSADYADHRLQFQEHMTEILKEAHNLEIKWSRTEKKGRETTFTREQVEKDGGRLIDKSLDETERHLQFMLDTLKKNREILKQKLLAEGKQGE